MKAASSTSKTVVQMILKQVLKEKEIKPEVITWNSKRKR
jgi:hypothetical protein